jgi:predicted NAD-dependent protein-ADP-ribosyltransferase YbiA (DUF1768 family)
MTPISPPNCTKATINGKEYKLVAFYYPDHDTAWDEIYQGQFLANFYPCQVSITIKGINGTFLTAEAAFQATKWWNDQNAREKFEQAKTGTEAFHIKKNLSNPDLTYAGLGRDVAMKEVLMQKFSDPAFQSALLLTNDAYLLEHNEQPGRDSYWSDNYDGTGQNQLGITLMEVREHYGGPAAPSGNYAVADFTKNVKENA